MGTLVVATRDATPDELRASLAGIPIIGGEVRSHGRWSSAHVLNLKFREVDACLRARPRVSLAAAADGMWKLTLFGPDAAPLSLYFDAALTDPATLSRLESQHQGSSKRLARALALPRADWPAPELSFATAADTMVTLQARRLLERLTALGVEYDEAAILDAMCCRGMTPAEREWECGNLPRLLAAMGLPDAFPGWAEIAR